MDQSCLQDIVPTGSHGKLANHAFRNFVCGGSCFVLLGV